MSVQEPVLELTLGIMLSVFCGSVVFFILSRVFIFSSWPINWAYWEALFVELGYAEPMFDPYVHDIGVERKSS